jgi:DNA-binding transcriptional ArsR family regulator
MEKQASKTELVPAIRKNLPNRILRAIDAALHLAGLPKSLKATFAELCRFVPQAEPLATIFAHKNKIAARIGTSERTVYRHLDQLKQEGLIDVLEQERKSRNGRFSVARIRLTQRAAQLVGLIEAEIEVVHSEPSDILTDGHTLTEPTISKSQPPQRSKNGLPTDLCQLTGKGLSRAGIFKLMGTAKAKGKKLSDVVTVVLGHIEELRGGRLYAYLAALCKGPTDFSAAAANERKRVADAKAGEVFKQKCQLFRQRFRSTTLTDRSQARLYLIDDRAQYVQVLGAGLKATQPLVDLSEWIKRIESGQLVLATLATERRILQVS